MAGGVAAAAGSPPSVREVAEQLAETRVVAQHVEVGVVREPLAVAVTPDSRSVVVSNHLPNVPTDIDLTGDVSPVVTIVDAENLSTTSVELFSGSNSLRGLCV